MLLVNPASMSSAPVRLSKDTSSPQWKPPRSKGSGAGAWMVMIVVSGRRRARPNDVKPAAESPMPCNRRRMFGVGVEVDEGGGVMVTVRLEGKSDWVGVLVGMVNVKERIILSLCLLRPIRPGWSLSESFGAWRRSHGGAGSGCGCWWLLLSLR